MWLIIFILVILAMISGIEYMISRFGKLSFIKKLAGDKKMKKALIASLPLIAVIGISTLTMGVVNAVVVILHLCAVWLIGDIVNVIVQKIRRKKSNYDIIAVSVIGFTAVWLGIGWYLAHNVWRTPYELQTEKSVGELRIVQISDSHIGATFHADGFAKQIERINEENPDVVVITGDFVDDGTTREDMIESSKALANLKSKYGVYFVFGNHDKGYYSEERRGYSVDELIENLESSNVKVLEDETVLIDNRFYIVGRQDKSEEVRVSMDELFKELDDDIYTVVLDHQPSDYDAQEKVQADLVLSGHTHGGQLIPITYVGEWTGVNDATYGEEMRSDTTFITSSGISDWEIKFKTGCKSEYVVIDVKGK